MWENVKDLCFWGHNKRNMGKIRSVLFSLRGLGCKKPLMNGIPERKSPSWGRSFPAGEGLGPGRRRWRCVLPEQGGTVQRAQWSLRGPCGLVTWMESGRTTDRSLSQSSSPPIHYTSTPFSWGGGSGRGAGEQAQGFWVQEPRQS